MSAASAISRKLANGVLAGEGNSTVVVSSGIANRKVNTTPCLRGHSREEEERLLRTLQHADFWSSIFRRRASARSVARQRERGNQGGVRTVDPGRKVES